MSTTAAICNTDRRHVVRGTVGIVKERTILGASSSRKLAVGGGGWRRSGA